MESQQFELLENSCTKVSALEAARKILILVPNDNKYLMGFFQACCQLYGYRIKSLEPKNNNNFLEVLKKESPSIVFIDKAHTTRLLKSLGWTAIQSIFRRKNTTLYGFKELASNIDKSLPNILFYKNFTEPMTLDEIIHSLQIRITVARERRVSERRRNGWDRHMSNKEQTATSFNTVPSLYHVSNKVPDMNHGSVEPFLDSILPVNTRDTSDNQSDSEKTRRVGQMIIDYKGKTVSVNGTFVKITQKEFKFIDLLAKQPGNVVNLTDIFKIVWPKNDRVAKSDLYQFIYMLRRKLEKNPYKPQLLVTVKGFGYKLCQ